MSAIPVLGGPAAELFSALITPPLVKRRDEWLEALAEKLEALEKRIEGFDAKAIFTNETFVTAVLHASQAALRTHQQEKLHALRNAVLNVAIGRSPDEDLQLLFFELIDRFTPWHLRILKRWSTPRGELKTGGMTVRQLLEETFPELRGRHEIYEPIVRDLVSHGLINFVTGWEGTSIDLNETTDFGQKFLRFIGAAV